MYKLVDKEGNVCHCRKDQLDVMFAAGFKTAEEASQSVKKAPAEAKPAKARQTKSVAKSED